MSVFLYCVAPIHILAFDKSSAYKRGLDRIDRLISACIPRSVEYKVCKLVTFLGDCFFLSLCAGSMFFLYNKYKERLIVKWLELDPGIRTGLSLSVLPKTIEAVYDVYVLFSYPYDWLIDCHGKYRRTSPSLRPKLIKNDPPMSKMLSCLRAGENPLLVGLSRSGKTSLVEKLVQDIEDNPDHPLRGMRVYRLNLEALQACKQADYYQRVFRLTNLLICSPGIILFVDEIHRMHETVHGINLADLWKEQIGRHGPIRVIGATTPGDIRTNRSMNAPLLEGRFVRIHMPISKWDALTKSIVRQSLVRDSSSYTIEDTELERVWRLALAYPMAIDPAYRTIQLVNDIVRYKRLENESGRGNSLEIEKEDIQFLSQRLQNEQMSREEAERMTIGRPDRRYSLRLAGLE